jgi:hypothetical protein
MEWLRAESRSARTTTADAKDAKIEEPLARRPN